MGSSPSDLGRRSHHLPPGRLRDHLARVPIPSDLASAGGYALPAGKAKAALRVSHSDLDWAALLLQ
ncbi:MAG: hypothetical protein M3O70_22865 [Actinomycetota bacterium]|nr:hypothetical protein [Actinomycetota bacterium]